VKAWAEMIAAHTTFVGAWFTATVTRVSPAVVAIVLTTTSSGLVAAWMALAAMKVGLVVTSMALVAMKVSLATIGDVLAAANVLEQFSE